MQTGTARSMLLSRVAPVDAGVSAAIIVAEDADHHAGCRCPTNAFVHQQPDKLIAVLVKMPPSPPGQVRPRRLLAKAFQGSRAPQPRQCAKL
jgi:hypothetical protein